MDLKETIYGKIDEEFIISLVEDFGGSYIRGKDTGEAIIFTTICHCGHSAKLYYYKESKSFFCYSECGSMTIFDFIMHCLECDFSEAIMFLKRELQIESCTGNLLAYRGLKSFGQIIYEREHKEEILKQQQEETLRIMNSKLPEINSKILNYFNYTVRTPWEDEGYEPWVLQEFNIGFHFPSQSIVIPHYNEKNALIGIRKRTFDKSLIPYGKYTPIAINNVTYAHRLGMNFFGLNKVKKAIKNNKKAIIVESEKAVIKSYQWFKKASLTIAPCTFNLTPWQIYCLVVRLKVKEIILCFDCDYIDNPELSYEIWFNKIKKIAKKIKEFDPEVKVTFMSDDGTYLGYKENCFDKDNKKIFQQMFLRRKEIIINEEDNM